MKETSRRSAGLRTLYVQKFLGKFEFKIACSNKENARTSDDANENNAKLPIQSKAKHLNRAILPRRREFFLVRVHQMVFKFRQRASLRASLLRKTLRLRGGRVSLQIDLLLDRRDDVANDRVVLGDAECR